MTRDGTALVPLGATSSRPNVARGPDVPATPAAASAVAAKDSIGSRRSSIRVAPAWLASPVKSKRQRPWGQISLARPTAASRCTRSRPCSTCSSTKQPTRPSQSAGPGRGSRPGGRHRVEQGYAAAVAQLAGGRRARRTGGQPRAQAGHAEARPLLLGEGRDDHRAAAAPRPARAARSRAANAETTPSGPSYAPPSRTESRWLPTRTASVVSTGPTDGRGPRSRAACRCRRPRAPSRGPPPERRTRPAARSRRR